MKVFLYYVLSFIVLSGVAYTNIGIEDAMPYQKHSSLQWKWATDSLARHNFAGDERILDIGCGDGKITAAIAERVARGIVIGIDISPKMIKLASRTHKKGVNNNLFFLEGDASELPFHSQFDLIFSSCTLHWIVDQKPAFEGIREALLPGGKALLVIPGISPSNLTILCKDLAETKKWKSYFPKFKNERVYRSEEEYTYLLKDAGFEIKAIQSREELQSFQDRKSLIAWLKPIIRNADHLSKELREEFFEDLLNKLISSATVTNTQGSIDIAFNKIVALVEKPTQGEYDPK